VSRVAPLIALVAFSLCSCPAPSPVPGDRTIGVFDFEAVLVEDGCQFLSGGLPSTFSATLSLETGSDRAFLTFGAASLEGTLTADRLSVSATSRRTTEEPCDCTFRLTERIEATVAKPGSCGADAGEPAALLPDGGLEIRQLCGFLRDEVSELDGSSCTCAPCAAVWTLDGTRQ